MATHLARILVLNTLLVSFALAAAAQGTAGSTQASPAPSATQARNRQVVESFFEALETQQFAKLRDIFAPDGRQVNAFVPAGFPKSFEGSEEIYKQYSGLTKLFGRLRFPRTIHTTEDPNYFFVEFKSDIDMLAGGKYRNDYIGTFRLRNGRVVEYTEYLNPLRLAEAFNIPLK